MPQDGMKPDPKELFLLIMKRAIDRQTLIVCTGAAFLCSVVGPFGTYSGVGAVGNFALWLLLIFAVTVCVYLCFAAITIVTGRTQGWPFHVSLVVAGALLGGTMIELLLSTFLDHMPPDRPTWSWLVLYVGVIMAAIVLIRLSVPAFNTSFEADLALMKHVAAGESGSVPDHKETAIPAHPRVRLADRLGLPEQAEILKVSADGHYIEVMTCARSYRTRLRFSDALKELEGLDGIVTHRSHWVAKSAIIGWVPYGPKPVVVLRDETRVPVSRTYRADVEELGLPEMESDAISA